MVAEFESFRHATLVFDQLWKDPFFFRSINSVRVIQLGLRLDLSSCGMSVANQTFRQVAMFIAIMN